MRCTSYLLIRDNFPTFEMTLAASKVMETNTNSKLHYRFTNMTEIQIQEV